MVLLNKDMIKYAYGQHFVSYIIIIHLIYFIIDIVFQQYNLMYFDLSKIIILIPIAIFTFDKNYDFSKIAISFIPFYFIMTYLSVISTWQFTMVCIIYFILHPLFLVAITNNWKLIKVVTIITIPAIISIPFTSEYLSNFLHIDYTDQYVLAFNLFTIINTTYAVFFNIYYISKINVSEKDNNISIAASAIDSPEMFSLETSTTKNNITKEDEKMQEVYQAIVDFYTHEKPWKDPGFDLTDLTNALNSNTKYISLALNKVGEKNFNNFTNKFRVEEVKNSLKNKEYTLYTIKHIYTQAGFNSQTSFNRVFKQFENISPQEYIKILEEK